jgi:predicted TIM-barrel fold metal-dependent hydrolase
LTTWRACTHKCLLVTRPGAHCNAWPGAWVKLSGWYRLGDQAPYAQLTEHIRRVAALAPERLVWGSDWPHTAFDTAAMPAYRSVWAPVVEALGASRAQAVLQAGASLYA